MPHYTGRNRTIQDYVRMETENMARDMGIPRSSLRSCEEFMSEGQKHDNKNENEHGNERENQHGNERENEHRNQQAQGNGSESESWISRGCMQKSAKSSVQNISGLNVHFCDDSLCNSSRFSGVGWLGFLIITLIAFSFTKLV
ncbi:hypothetical protein Anas_09910 [Armadillidium nasatum]|uniref:Uncharacterized protein n=1 Tax=Armadillidium nasatum TaxID=96803 RepID=A0A5N5T6L9_9CRUS|nr:hypothetical protein Anas_09910 [Armadillidium nasatum]